MKHQEVQIGEIWLLNQTQDAWLVTRTYSELFAFYAVMRKVSGRDPELRRVKVERSAEGPVLAGFSRVDEPD